MILDECKDDLKCFDEFVVNGYGSGPSVTQAERISQEFLWEQ